MFLSCLCQAGEEDGGEERVEMEEVRVATRHYTGEGEEEVEEDPWVWCVHMEPWQGHKFDLQIVLINPDFLFIEKPNENDSWIKYLNKVVI